MPRMSILKLTAIAAALALTLFGLAACGGGGGGGGNSGSGAVHAISVAKGSVSDIIDYPTSAKAGEVVDILTVSVTDADLYVNATGADAKCVTDGHWQFTMPDQDVVLSVSIDTSNYPGA